MAPHRHDARLQRDLLRLAAQTPRRRFLQLMMCASAVPALLACGSTSTEGDGDTDDDTSGGGSDPLEDGGGMDGGTCTRIPEETAGPYPGDGSNGPNALALSGIVRSDLTHSIGGASGVAEGVKLTVKIKLVNVNDGCRALTGYAVYLWHCDREGRYSMYSTGVTSENYLRGVQEADDDGVVTFETVFPGCYAGRMPHIHFEVYAGLDAATKASSKLATSQLAFPTETCRTVYAESGYETSVRNLSGISFASDNVFSDGVDDQLATLTGSVAEGYVATLTVGVND